ncbi:MAG: FAD-binding oxidoreductase [Patescibacteria group bacterium]
MKLIDVYSRRNLLVLAAGVIFIFISYKVWYLTEEPGEDKDCNPLFPDEADGTNLQIAPADESTIAWFRRGGYLNDASCLDETAVYGVVKITSEEDVANALAYAATRDLQVSVAGVKHSMGGQAFAKGALVLDMTSFNAITLNATSSTVIVRAGATWHEIQKVIHPQFAIMSMQSTDVFSVGGSISVNAHGMDHRSGAVENSINSLKVMLPDGTIKTVSRTENTDLYEMVVGGYGLSAVILEAELKLVPNELYTSRREIISYQDFPARFTDINQNDNIGLMYTHLSTAPGESFLKEGIMYIYEKSDEDVALADIPPLGEVSGVKLRRLLMNVSKYGGAWQTLRWWGEKYIEPKMESCSISRNAAQSSGEACLVSRNEPMHDSVPYLYNSLKKETDILHEYFIPRDNLVAFIDTLRTIMVEEEVNLLNASIRVVNAERGYLTYAPEEAFSVVLYINQKTTPEADIKMKRVTQLLIDASTAVGGRFFLPYQLHYTPLQLKTAYPTIDEFFAKKRVYDPQELLGNTWYNRYGKSEAISI